MNMVYNFFRDLWHSSKLPNILYIMYCRYTTVSSIQWTACNWSKHTMWRFEILSNICIYAQLFYWPPKLRLRKIVVFGLPMWYKWYLKYCLRKYIYIYILTHLYILICQQGRVYIYEIKAYFNRAIFTRNIIDLINSDIFYF